MISENSRKASNPWVLLTSQFSIGALIAREIGSAEYNLKIAVIEVLPPLYPWGLFVYLFEIFIDHKTGCAIR
jgi:hypothetical protein